MPSNDPERLVLTLPSTFDALELAVESVQEFLGSMDLKGDLAHNVLLLASEAITNAMEHGNGWDEAKQVEVTVGVVEGCVVVSVLDEGTGFRVAAVPDPLQEQHMLRDGGRGLFLMQELADKVEYSDGGRRVRLEFVVKG